MQTAKKYRKDIQALRGIAVIAVVFFHAEIEYFPLGFLGVDVFFVISGFVVTPLILRIFTNRSSETRFSSLRSFYGRRFFRLAPALASTLGISALVIFLVGPVADHARFARQGIATLMLSGNLGAYRYAGDYFSPNPNPLVHTWSLSVEEQIYLLLPLLLIVIIHNSRNLKRIPVAVYSIFTVVSFALFVSPTLLSPIYSLVNINSIDLFSFYAPYGRIWQFCIGGLGYFFLERHKDNLILIPRSMTAIFLAFLVFILFGPMHITSILGSVLATFIALAVVLTNSLIILPGKAFRGLEWVGDRSYSIYLVHMPLLYIAKYSPIWQKGINGSQQFQIALAVLASFFLGALSYSKIENRYRNEGKISTYSVKRFLVVLALTFSVPVALFGVLDRSSHIAITNSGLPPTSKSPFWFESQDCGIFSTEKDMNHSPCFYGNNQSKKSILIIGDSHAASDSISIRKLARMNNMATFIFTFQGCGFVLEIHDFNPKYSYPYLSPGCIAHNQEILRFVQETKPTIIIWAHRSPSIFVLPNNFASRNQYNEMVARSLATLMKQGSAVINIGSEPELEGIRTRIQDWLGSKASFSRIPFEDNYFWEDKKATTYYLNTLEIFCPNNLCTNRSKKGWLFQDADHLSKIGADMLIPKLDRMVKEILNRNL